jgi:acylphosphatase
MVRLTVHFTGRVQGVGFRYTVREIAASHPVAGSVRNLDDGRVRLVVEADAVQAMRFIEQVKLAMSRHITHVTLDESPATGEFGDVFTIHH